MEEDVQLFCSIGLSEQKAKETLKNSQVTCNLKTAIDEVKKYKAITAVNGNLIYHIASKIKAQIVCQLPFLVQYIVNDKLDSVQRVDCALDYLLEHVTEFINIKEFEDACGIGVIVTPEEIEKEVENCIKKYKPDILKRRYHFNTGLLMQEIRKSLKWADGKTIKNEIDVQLLDLLGDRNEADCKSLTKRTKNQSEVKQFKKPCGELLIQNGKRNEGYLSIIDTIKTKTSFHKPGENFKTEGYIITTNTQKLLQEHLTITGGEVRTRFPPEPNGILHIGHAKAININFGYADAFNGSCYLRYDDTNPEKEEEQFVKGILDIVQWLGYEPCKVTYSSDYFDLLFQWAICLIKKDLAYVCHQNSSEIKGFKPLPSPWRNRSIQDSLNIFQDMKDGLLDEGEATLRMKLTLEEGKQDPVAYRIKFSPHHRTSDKWCIYPTYDFTHCLCDSIENITHSLCTKEFQSRRSSYYWLCNSLNIYCPVQWEYGRLNVSYTVVSKRKIANLINKKVVENWDDPRLFTLSALRRRGFPPEAINNFCAKMGVTGAQSIVDPTALEAAVRDILNITAPRCMVVFEPVKLIIRNFPYSDPITISVPDFPGMKNELNHMITFDKIIYIDASDFREIAEKNYTRLSLKQSVGLKYAGVALTVENVERDSSNKIVNIVVKQEPISENCKPKSFIQWVSHPLLITVRTYEKLFHHRNPEDLTEVPNGFLSDINHSSKKEFIAYIDSHYKSTLNSFAKYQFERIGFFAVDPDSELQKVIFNRTVTLKEAHWNT